MGSKKFTFVVVDDNPNTVIILNYLLEGSGFEGEVIYYENPMDALVYFEVHSCDLLFLDIEMPEMSGFDFLTQLEISPYTIILTSYPAKYAERAFQFLDKKLLDFISKDELIYSFPRVKDRFLKNYTDQFLYVKSEHNSDFFTRIPIGTIKYFSKSRNIVNVIVEGEENSNYYIEGTLENIENLLPKGSFYRVRKSTLIMISHMKCYISGTIIMGVDAQGKDIVIEVPHRERKKIIDFFIKRHSMTVFKA